MSSNQKLVLMIGAAAVGGAVAACCITLMVLAFLPESRRQPEPEPAPRVIIVTQAPPRTSRAPGAAPEKSGPQSLPGQYDPKDLENLVKASQSMQQSQTGTPGLQAATDLGLASQKALKQTNDVMRGLGIGAQPNNLPDPGPPPGSQDAAKLSTEGEQKAAARIQKLTRWRQLRQGMTPADVKLLLGEPGKVEKTAGGAVWLYQASPTSAFVRFDPLFGTVAAWAPP